MTTVQFLFTLKKKKTAFNSQESPVSRTNSATVFGPISGARRCVGLRLPHPGPPFLMPQRIRKSGTAIVHVGVLLKLSNWKCS